MQFSEKQLNELDKQLDKRFVSNRKGASGRTLRYLEGHDAIDQANRIFGHGNWAYEPISCEQTLIRDPFTGDPVGITYKAKVRLEVRGCVNHIIEVGSQPVASCSVEDVVMTRRRKEASNRNCKIDESPFNAYEISTARGIIMESHEQAEKGAVTDALKRALRTFGEQFGNGLYGDGRVLVDDAQQDEQEPAQLRKTPIGNTEPGSTSDSQRVAIHNLFKLLGEDMPDISDWSFVQAASAIFELQGRLKCRARGVPVHA